MEKKISVCDGCGSEWTYVPLKPCCVCGKELCGACRIDFTLQRKVGADSPYFTLCPTHYKEVKECINILKGEKKPVGEALYYEVSEKHGPITEVRVNGVKFVPEKPNFEVHFDGELGVKGQYVMMDFRTDRAFRVDGDAAAALFAYMEKERGR